MKLSSFTCLGFEANSVLDSCPKFKLSFAEVHDSAERGMLVEDLAERFGDKADFSLILSDEDELTDVDLALSDAVTALDRHEITKADVSKSGFCLVIALVLEAIQEQFLSKARLENQDLV